MEKIEIGEYVKTKDGIIDKVKNFSVNCCIWHCENGMCIDEYNRISVHLEDIVKHSKNLIDLIEVGDYVNGKYVKKIKDYADGKYILALIGIIKEQDIKTILTKEQMEANCYKVRANDEKI